MSYAFHYDAKAVNRANPSIMNDKAPRYNRSLLISRWCAVCPLLTGLFAMSTWLASGGSLADVGPFYLAGMLSICMALIGWPVGFILLLRAKKLGAPGALITHFILILAITFLIASASWWTGRALTDLQVFRVTNQTQQVIHSIEVWCEPKRAEKHGKKLLAIAPGETRIWALRYPNEGCATFRWPRTSDFIEPSKDERVFLGIGQPTVVAITLDENGSYSMQGGVAPRWMWIDALKSYWFAQP